MDTSKLRCCLFCGRDTTSRCGICSRCRGHNHRRSQPDIDNSDDEPLPEHGEVYGELLHCVVTPGGRRVRL